MTATVGWQSGARLAGGMHAYDVQKEVLDHYERHPEPRDESFIYHGEPVIWLAWICRHCDIIVEKDYCPACDDKWSERATEYVMRHGASARREVADKIGENPAWQPELVILYPCNFPNNGYLGHTECQDDEHHFGYDLHIADLDLHIVAEEREWLAGL